MEGSLNRNRGGRAGLPRQAELIPLILATPLAAGTSAGPAWHGRQVHWRGEMGRDGACHPPPPGRGGSVQDAQLSPHVVKSVRSNSSFFFSAVLHSKYIFPCYLPQIATLGLTTVLDHVHFCLKKMYTSW